MEPRDGEDSRGDPDERPDREVHAYLEGFARALTSGNSAGAGRDVGDARTGDRRRRGARGDARGIILDEKGREMGATTRGI